MPQVSHIDGIEAQVRAACDAIDAFVVPSLLLSNDGSTPPEAYLPINDLLGLIDALKPRVVYLATVPFDALPDAFQLAEFATEPDVDEDTAYKAFAALPRVKSLLKRWKSHDGARSHIFVSVMYNGVLHHSSAQESWHDDFVADVEQIKEAVQQERDNRARDQQTGRRAELRDKAEFLLADPRFHAPRGSRDKRVFLAQSLFPGLARSEIYEIVDIADNLAWLDSSRGG